MSSLRIRLAGAIADATDGAVSAQEVLSSDASLTALGMTSLGYVRLLDVLDSEFGVFVGFDETMPKTIDDLVRRVETGTTK